MSLMCARARFNIVPLIGVQSAPVRHERDSHVSSIVELSNALGHGTWFVPSGVGISGERQRVGVQP